MCSVHVDRGTEHMLSWGKRTMLQRVVAWAGLVLNIDPGVFRVYVLNHPLYKNQNKTKRTLRGVDTLEALFYQF